ncbi:MAG: hypothetical protein ACT4PT_00165 [Methanobacteriota archaeon]
MDGPTPTAEDVERALGAGYSDTEVLELALAATIGAATGRLAAGLRALDDAVMGGHA